jgi:tRNA/rRNA methyltransferase
MAEGHTLAAADGAVAIAADREPCPVRAADGRPVADIVAAAHEHGVDVAMRAGPDGMPAMRSEELEALLVYCAKQRCVDQDVSCPGCRHRTRQQKIGDLDDFVRRHREVRIAAGGIVLEGHGDDVVDARSLDWLAHNWSGEEYWFWARRVLRKLRYGIRQVGDLLDDDATRQLAPSVLLMEPQIPENIGMVARAMGNFGLHDLRVIAPRDGWPSEKARAVASGAAAIIDDARLEDTLENATRDLNWLAATTARQRDMRKPVMTPEEAAREMLRRTQAGERCGILFGRERHGLQSEEVAVADAAVMIPINNRFASLNLAQAVLLLGYEWLKAAGGASLGRVTSYEKPVESGLNLGHDRIADKQALYGFFDHIEAELERLGFFYPPQRRHVVVRNLRTMFTRMQLTDQEVRTLRGIVATLAHGKGKARKPQE